MVTPDERLRRLEDGFCALMVYVTEGQIQRATRSLTAPGEGAAVVELYQTIQAERNQSMSQAQ